MARRKSKPWLEKGRANRLAGPPGAGTKRAATGAQQKQQQQQQPAKKKHKPSSAKPATSPPTTESPLHEPHPQDRDQAQPPKGDHHHQQPQQQKQSHQKDTPYIPFDPNERILLIGDGDLSFARSIVEHHGCADVLATVYDDRATLLEKYPQAADNIAYLEGEGQRVLCGIDATKLHTYKEIRKGGLSGGLVDTNTDGKKKAESSGDGGGGNWDRILFNFPHVGGKSTDVNRQVRYNQALLVSFFTAALPLLCRGPSPDSPVSPAATVAVTLFEGEPYTLWNVRDLARHVGLRVQRSFRFRADAYPGYRHARTLGNVEGERGGKWKGEEREARTFVFEAGEVAANGGGGGGGPAGKKRKKGGAGDESDSDD